VPPREWEANESLELTELRNVRDWVKNYHIGFEITMQIILSFERWCARLPAIKTRQAYSVAGIIRNESDWIVGPSATRFLGGF
jgi:hypothetical protein